LAGCCARAASGHTAAPPSAAMKSRRSMAIPPDGRGRLTPFPRRNSVRINEIRPLGRQHFEPRERRVLRAPRYEGGWYGSSP
jgi:hypothetical protein